LSLRSGPWIWKSLLTVVLYFHLALGKLTLKNQSIQPDQLVWID
jgi:hypothetical protein